MRALLKFQKTHRHELEAHAWDVLKSQTEVHHQGGITDQFVSIIVETEVVRSSVSNAPSLQVALAGVFSAPSTEIRKIYGVNGRNVEVLEPFLRDQERAREVRLHSIPLFLEAPNIPVINMYALLHD